MNVSPRKKQTLELEEIVKDCQAYSPVAKPEDVTSKLFGYASLSDERIKNLSRIALKQDPSLKGINGYFVLDEGILNDTVYGLGRLLVSMQYNFATDNPLIEVPGKWIDVCDRRQTGIFVKLLNGDEQMVFIERILKKSHELTRQVAYTGDYRIWPGYTPPSMLTNRTIHI